MVWVRLGLVVFVLAWLFDIAGARSYVPIWAAFLVALGLELQYFFGARRSRPRVRERDEDEELLLVRDGDDELWIPYAGESPDEIDELVAEARAQAEVEDALEADVPARRSLRPLLVGLGVIAALAAIVWFAGSRGWDGLNDEQKAEATARFSAEASRIVGRPRRDPVRRVGTDRRRGAALRRGRRGRRRRRVPHPRSLLRPLPPGVRGRRAVQPDGARGRGARARVVASQRRARRGPNRVLRAPVGRRPRETTRHDRRHGATHDAPAAGRERAARAPATWSTSSPRSAATAASST